jgi:transposase InsO family protein
MIVMGGSHRLSIEQMGAFVAASGELEMAAATGAEGRRTVGEVLAAQQYGSLGRRAKGIVRRYLMRVTGYGRAQIARLIQGYTRSGGAPESLPLGRRRRFAQRYTSRDIELLADTDAAHDGLSGAAVRRLLFRAWAVFGDAEYHRLAEISVSHIYNLRKTEAYRHGRAVYRPTQSTPTAVGERRCPDPKGAPGWLRVDTVHQGDPRDGHAGLYHLNAVDTVTQWQVIGCVETISETHLLPVLEAMLHQFPFTILGFHSDNGSEFINYKVAGLLEKLRVEAFTKSRANRTTDNALVEGKNGSVIRKHIGYGHLPAPYAASFQRFYMAYLNPYLNFHRPCGFATVTVNDRGKRRRRYPAADYRTPYEKLQLIDSWEKHLKPGITRERLASQAAATTDLDSAQRMQKARNELLASSRADTAGSEQGIAEAKGRALKPPPLPSALPSPAPPNPGRKEA